MKVEFLPDKSVWIVKSYYRGSDAPDTIEAFKHEQDAELHSQAIEKYYDLVLVEKIPLFETMSPSAKHMLKEQAEGFDPVEY
jgi:predicted glycosyltransferase